MTRQYPLVVKQLVVGQMATNCYLLKDVPTNEALLIDPGDDPEYIMENLESLQAKPQAMVVTHGHFDHLLGARALQAAYNLPFIINAGDLFLVEQMERGAAYYLGLRRVDPPPQVTGTVKDGDSLRLGHHWLAVMHTPGHTPGSISLYSANERILFVGDTLFAGGGVGRTDFSYSSPQKLTSSIKKILSLPAETSLYPGHGERTWVKSERPHHSV